ncbi:MAG: hypothetical protein ACRER3_08605, partial [Pseudomonas fluorescens]
MYFSAQTGGFYSAEFHGARLNTIQDPAWIRPRVDIVVQPGESAWVDGELIGNSGDEPITLRDVPDMSAFSDTLEVANPDCLIPEDAVEIPYERYKELLDGLSLPGGKRIAVDEEGYPMLIDPPPLSPEFFAAIERAWRDGQLAATDGVVSRHRDEMEEGSETTLTPTQYT